MVRQNKYVEQERSSMNFVLSTHDSCSVSMTFQLLSLFIQFVWKKPPVYLHYKVIALQRILNWHHHNCEKQLVSMEKCMAGKKLAQVSMAS